MTAIPWPDHTFDFVFATSVFEHVSDQGLAYREIHRVLKPGGRVLNIFPQNGSHSKRTQTFLLAESSPPVLI